MRTAAEIDVANRGRSRIWSAVLDLYLRGAPTPLMRFAWRRNTALPFRELLVAGRRTGRERRLLVSLIQVGERRFVGHPNGRAAWTDNVAAAGTCTLVDRDGTAERVRMVEVSNPADRDAVIDATTRLPAPSGWIYRAARKHIRAIGRFFEVLPATESRS